MRKASIMALMGGVSCSAMAPSVAAEELLSFTGRVALADGVAPDGVKVKLQVDLDRDGKLQSFETVSATTAADGSYDVRYEIDAKDVDLELVKLVASVVAEYQARGFDSLLDDGPLPVVLTFQREGYGTVVRRLSTLFQNPSLDAALAPLSAVQCADGSCLSTNGGVRFGDFPGGTKIARAYADAYDPSLNTTRFPGSFTDRDNALLVSSGFAEINLYRDDGSPVHELGAPVKTRFEANRASWATLPDLQPNSGRIELPMYSFDPATAEWVPEPDGELTLANGRVVSEDELSSLRDGSFEQPVFVSFETKHFSTFNCDAPIDIRACVRGTLVSKLTGKALPGVSVSVDGVTYTGTAGAMVTGTDGAFAMDVRKSELPDEDLDRNGEAGEPLEARVVVSGVGVFIGEPFETPTTKATVGSASRPSCRPSECDCLDLGTIEVELEEPRLCEVSVEAVYSGEHVIGTGGPLEASDVVVGATVRASLVGGVQLPLASVAAICGGAACAPSTVPASGRTTFSVPVAGDSPQIQLDASWSTEEGGVLHHYSGSRVVTGCSRGESAAPAFDALALDHSGVTGLGDYIAALGEFVPPSGGAGRSNDRDDPLGGCGCTHVGGDRTPRAVLLSALALGVLGMRRRQKS
ncbi:MAG: hypothetical protein K0R38_5129 [Polyangiaceae bacterium]|jgi:MYXO-CTERM domain-containing protein|nr:hypothetical protein [Polyangiaceae bacterium]